MLTKRIIPCLDVKGGRVVKGVQFLELRDAGDPVEIAAMLRPAGGRRTDLSRHHRIERRAATPSSMWSASTAERVFMPLTVGGGIRDGRRYPPDAQRRRRQGLDQHRRGAPPGLCPRGRRAFRFPVHRGGHRRPPGARIEHALGGLHPRRPQADRHRRRRVGGADGVRSAPARSS